MTAALASLAAGCAPPRLIQPVAPAALGRSVAVRQQITAHYKGETRTLQIALKVVPDDLFLIGLSAVGERLFTLSWNGRTARVTSPIEDFRQLPPKRVLADLELAYWPLASLRAALVDPEMRLEQLGTARTLWQGNRLLWLAYSAAGKPWQSAMTVYNASAGYRLDIRPLAMNGSGR